MSQAPPHADLPLHATLRGSPAVRPSNLRRQIGMAVLLFLLVAIICAYWIITDSRRVKAMAEQYLSEIIGGRVEVQRAHLSVFEGLRLEGVRIYVDEKDLPDSRIFTARTFLVRANLGALLNGRLEADQIMALDPHVRLCENVDTGEWNYQRFKRRGQGTTKPSESSGETVVLPEMLLRAGLIEYSRVVRGNYELLGSMAIDGQLTPTDRDKYIFDLQGRAPGEPLGPRLRGVLQMDKPAVMATLKNFEFNRTIRAMLPSQVQDWWETHQLAGRISIPKFEYSPSQPGQEARWEIEIEVDNVRLAILPEEIMGRKDFERVTRFRPGFPVGGLPDVGLAGRNASYDQVIQPQPIALHHVSGRFVFTPDQIRFTGVRGRIENNAVVISGAVFGYSPGARAAVQITANTIRMPQVPRYLNSLPRNIRTLYHEIRPEGIGQLTAGLARTEEDGPIAVSAELKIFKGSFCFHEFAYPLRDVTGTITFGIDPDTGWERVDLKNLRGIGLEGTPNAGAYAEVSGYISPLSKGSGVDLRVHGANVWLDDHVRRALPREARESIEWLDPEVTRRAKPGVTAPDVPFAVYGDFAAHIMRPPGLKKKMKVDVDIDVKHASGAFREFGYPLRKMFGQVFVRSNHVELRNVKVEHEDAQASLAIDGKISWAKNRPVEPDLHIRAANVLIDEELRLAIPEQQRQWLDRMALQGRIDVDGRVFLANKHDPKIADVDFDLGIKLREGLVWPVGKQHALTAIDAEVRLTQQELRLDAVRGKRGDAEVIGKGVVSWPDDRPQLSLTAELHDVLLDRTFYQLVPKGAQDAWDELRPEGSVDLTITYRGAIGDSAEPAAAAVEAPAAGAALPAPVAAAASADTFDIVITPKRLALSPLFFPYRMGSITGQARVTPEQVTLTDMTARRGDSVLKLSGIGTGKGYSLWKLAMSGDSIPVDQDLYVALPEGLQDFVDGVTFAGLMSFDATKFEYETLPPRPAGATPPAPKPRRPRKRMADVPAVASKAATPDEPFRMDFEGRVNFTDASMDVGIPLLKIQGGADLKVAIVDGDLHTMSGTIDAASIDLADRPITDLRSHIIKPADRDLFQFPDLRAKFAGGDLSMQVDLIVPDEGNSRYGIAAVLRDVDVRELVGETSADAKMKGRLAGSLALEGTVDDQASRRGRGDVVVQGKELYRVPVVFGMLQVAHLALPIKSPFTEATTRYSVDGNKVTFDSIELRAKDMIMQGSGWLNFATKRLEMTFVTDNPNWPKIPLIDDLIEGAKRELLQVRVTGTVEEPKVKARAMSTFTTTIDEITKGRPKKD